MGQDQGAQTGGQTEEPRVESPSPPYRGDVVEVEPTAYGTQPGRRDVSITRFIFFRAHGRFAVSLNDPSLSPDAKVFASITEVDGARLPFLGLADAKIYNVVPTSGRVTIRGEALWDADISLRISLDIS